VKGGGKGENGREGKSGEVKKGIRAILPRKEK